MLSECGISESKITTQSYEILTTFLFFVEEIIDLYPRLTIVNLSIWSTTAIMSI